jgi:hypothetical protein
MMLTSRPAKVACGLDLYRQLPSVPAGACRGVNFTLPSIHEYALKDTDFSIEDCVPSLGAKSRYFPPPSLVNSNLRLFTDNTQAG